MEEENFKKVKMFQGRKVRTHWDDENEKWLFSIVDIIAVLTESVDPFAYWRKLKQRLLEEGNETVTNCHTLKMVAQDGKLRETDVGDTEQIFRLIQSVPSKKAEPFKRWLARVGYERVQEIENPELAQDRMKKLYEVKGYSKSWIDKRLRGIAVRQDLTDEWQERGVSGERDFAILTAEISRVAFGMAPTEYKKYKGLKNENLRDHMTDLELIFSMLGEASTAELERTNNPESFEEHISASHEGGKVAKIAMSELEKRTRESVITKTNYLKIKEKEKREKVKKKKKIKLEIIS